MAKKKLETAIEEVMEVLDEMTQETPEQPQEPQPTQQPQSGLMHWEPVVRDQDCKDCGL